MLKISYCISIHLAAFLCPHQYHSQLNSQLMNHYHSITHYWIRFLLLMNGFNLRVLQTRLCPWPMWWKHSEVLQWLLSISKETDLFLIFLWQRNWSFHAWIRHILIRYVRTLLIDYYHFIQHLNLVLFNKPWSLTLHTFYLTNRILLYWQYSWSYSCTSKTRSMKTKCLQTTSNSLISLLY
jgi:hypothetical protein